MANKKTLTFQGFNLNKKSPFKSLLFFCRLKKFGVFLIEQGYGFYSF